MDGWLTWLPWVLGGLALIFVLAVLKRPLKWLGRVAARSGVGLLVLALVGQVGPLVGIHLGVNLPNALVMGTLGAPGFGLLLLFHWMLG